MLAGRDPEGGPPNHAAEDDPPEGDAPRERSAELEADRAPRELDPAAAREASTVVARRASSPGLRIERPSQAIFGTHYRVERTLGGGGMGEVFLARDELLDRWVAVKVLREDVATTPGARERFRAEARAMARLRHPHVVGVHAFGEERGRPYLVIEHVPGEPLHRWAARRGRLGLDAAVAILDQICRGVSAIHAAGLVHRDLKPGNVLVGPSARVAIADLGLAAAIREGDPGEAWGTPGYGAPEIFEGTELPPELRTRCDVFSVGVIAYELLTGRLPYESDVAMLASHARGELPPAPSELVPALPRAIDAAIMAAIAIAPAERTRSIDAFRRALLDAAERAPREARAPRIVVVDDDEDYRELVLHALRRAFPGATLEACADATCALAAARRERPDLVVTDLDMPGLDGTALIGELRRDPRTRTVPVLVVSACASSTDWTLLCRVGGDAFVSKPFEAQQLAIAARGAIERS